MDYTARHRAMLKAISEGRGRLTGERHPSLAVDGLWCDFTATADLLGGGLVASASGAAVLTTSGAALLRSLTTA